MTITQTTEEVLIRPERRIGEFTTYLTVEENEKDELEITQHPVQQGASIVDHAYVKPSSVSIKIMFNDQDVPIDETYQKLLALQSSREPFELVTGKRIYKNMLFKSLSVTTDRNTMNILSVSAELQEVIIVSVSVTSVPPRKRQKTHGKTGATEKAGVKKTQKEDENKSKSVGLKLKQLITG